MAEQSLQDEEFLRDVLNDKIPVIPKLADLPGLWRETPEDAYDPDHPGFRLRLSYLVACIVLADTKPWAREGLRQLHRELLENGEPVPPLLDGWLHDQLAQGEPASRRGRPEESDRDLRVLTMFKTLSDEGLTRQDAIFKIADWMDCSHETVRSILHKHRAALRDR